jgi:hypothetical protein
MEAITERELLLQLNNDVKHMRETFSDSVDRLSETIDRFGKSMEKIETEKISVMQLEIDSLKAWRQELKGGYKLAMLFWGLITAGIAGLVAYLFKKH